MLSSSRLRGRRHVGGRDGISWLAFMDGLGLALCDGFLALRRDRLFGNKRQHDLNETSSLNLILGSFVVSSSNA